MSRVTSANIDPTASVLEQWAATLLAPWAVKNPTGSPKIRLKQFSTRGTLIPTDRQTSIYRCITSTSVSAIPMTSNIRTIVISRSPSLQGRTLLTNTPPHTEDVTLTTARTIESRTVQKKSPPRGYSRLRKCPITSFRPRPFAPNLEAGATRSRMLAKPPQNLLRETPPSLPVGLLTTMQLWYPNPPFLLVCPPCLLLRWITR